MNLEITPGKLHGTVDILPSKSHAHRLLIACRLAEAQGSPAAPETIPSFSRDIEATKGCLAQLDKAMPFLDCGESGSTLRFMLPVAMALKDEACFIGSGRLPERPISPLKEEMEKHGCTFYMNRDHRPSDRHKEICTVTGPLRPGAYSLPGNISSQFITGLLFALPLLNGDSVLSLTTPLESAGYVDLTLEVLGSFGIDIDVSLSGEGCYIYEIKGNQKYKAPDRLSLEGDWSNAAFWLVCGALGGTITCRGLSLSSSQKDREIVSILESMGAQIEAADSEITVSCPSGKLKAVEVSVAQIPDLVPPLAVAMARAEGSSMIKDGERLKIKESDRLKTVYDLLSRLGADISYGGTGLSFTGLPSLAGGRVSSHNDHRIAMAAAAASCICREPVIITGAEAVEKSYPDFFRDFKALGGTVREVQGEVKAVKL
ncbi:MAG TPA: 3-phosphoshikimate 1-carboxyvinyltransferase [Candidatus Copromorpha excrementigallinarum]|uniref:3-phosphoshikimate 1-carboxyvinyltransferase n=1 Tax=Candidatus Allocopromorpha excrementigallinarum TaxID=2840742 RepID=A0A9D1L824_9FIRM|nr:3-phosphoshikimate 1-carboxyvinyltransferase [Candidatus Copromorpha excrementigallinarum]